MIKRKLKMKKRFWETDRQFKTRQDVDFAKKSIQDKKLWRITAIEMKRVNGGFQMGREDHFAVTAYCSEMAVGLFKADKMDWFVTKVEPETIID